MILTFTLIDSAESIYKSGVAYGLIDPIKLAEYRLAAAPTTQFISEIEDAIEQQDYDYAQSLYRLGIHYGHDLSPELQQRAAATPIKLAYATGMKSMRGFVFGATDSGAALAGALVSDLVGVGDVRDFTKQGWLYASGRDYDPFLFGISAVGLGITATTLTSFGATGVADAGVSVIKNAYRSGRMSKPLLKYFSKNTAKLVDMQLLKQEFKASASTGLSQYARLEKATAKSIDKVAAKALVEDAGVVASITQKGGARASLEALSIARGPGELVHLQRIVYRFGGESATIMKFLGRSVLRLTRWTAEMLHVLISLGLILAYAIGRIVLRLGLRAALANTSAYHRAAVLAALSGQGWPGGYAHRASHEPCHPRGPVGCRRANLGHGAGIRAHLAGDCTCYDIAVFHCAGGSNLSRRNGRRGALGGDSHRLYRRNDHLAAMVRNLHHGRLPAHHLRIAVGRIIALYQKPDI